MLYKATCVKCEEKAGTEVLPTYIGETFRTAHIRANQQKNDCRKVIRQDLEQLILEPLVRMQDCSSWIVDHHRSKHHQEKPPDPETDYRFELLSKHKDPMSRQVEEACRISQTLERQTITTTSWERIPILSLNRKGESFAPRSRPEFFY